MYIQTMYINFIVLEGYLLQRPSLKFASNGERYFTFILANKNRQEKTPDDGSAVLLREDNIITCVAYEKSCNNIVLNSLDQGTFIRINGELKGKGNRHYVNVYSIKGFAFPKDRRIIGVKISMNQIILSGRLVTTPQFIEGATPTKNRALFVIANVEGWGESKKTTFFKCVAFGTVAKFISTMDKGKPIYVIGTISENKYTDQQGVEHKSMQVVVQQAEYIYNKAVESTEAQNMHSINDSELEKVNNSGNVNNFSISGDDLPF